MTTAQFILSRVGFGPVGLKSSHVSHRTILTYPISRTKADLQANHRHYEENPGDGYAPNPLAPPTHIERAVLIIWVVLIEAPSNHREDVADLGSEGGAREEGQEGSLRADGDSPKSCSEHKNRGGCIIGCFGCRRDGAKPCVSRECSIATVSEIDTRGCDELCNKGHTLVLRTAQTVVIGSISKEIYSRRRPRRPYCKRS
jgi:hypothetical protein